jgi:hypothetical protein
MVTRREKSPTGDAAGDRRRRVSRRKVVTRGAGLVAVGAVGATFLSEARSSPAAANTITEQGAWAPAVVTLQDAPTIAVDASLGNDFRVTISGDRTVGNPANPAPGQNTIFQVTQGTGGSFTLSWGSSYEFSTGLPQPTLSTGAGQTDLLGFIYNGATSTWLFAAYVSGFS